MENTALAGAKRIWKIRLQLYLIPDILVFPVILGCLYVISTDKRICKYVRFRIDCCFAEATNFHNFIS